MLPTTGRKAATRTARPAAASPYAGAIAGVPVRRSERQLAGATTRLWTYRPDHPGPHVVFLHGLRGDHHGLEPIVAHLDGCRVTVADLPGFGASPPMPDRAHDLAGYRDWARELLAAVAPAGDAVLAGHSFGSIVAAAAVAADADGPDDGDGLDDGGGAGGGTGAAVRALVLVNPIATAALAGPHRVLTRITVTHHGLAGALPERAGHWLLRNRLVTRIASTAMVTTPDRSLRRWIHAEHDRYFGGFAGRDSLLQAFGASIRHDVAGFAGRIAVPTLLVAAERDDIVPPPAQHALLPRFPDARLVLLPGTGHLAHYEAPAAVAAAVRDFLDEHLPDRRTDRPDEHPAPHAGPTADARPGIA